MAESFGESEFQRWVRVLRLTRHHVAHQGTAMLSALLEMPTDEPTEAEIDREIEKWPEWRGLPSAVAELFRPTLRAEWQKRHYRQISDAAFIIPGETEDRAIVFPLESIE